MKLHWIFNRFMGPAGDDLSTGGGAVDRGDDFTPTGDDANPVLNEQDGTPGDDKAGTTDDTAAGEGESALREDANTEVNPDETVEGETEAEKTKRQAGKRIPLDRHEKILAKEREKRQELERQLAQFQQGQKVAEVNADLTKLEDRIVDLEKQYNEAMGDGDVAKATQLMRELRSLDRQVSETRSEMRAAAAEARAVEQVRYSTALERIEETFPVLNPDHEDYDAETLQDVADLKATYERRGLTPTQALQRAVKKLLDVENTRQREATEVQPRVKAADVAAQRKKGAVTKTVDAVTRTPPNASKVGMDSDKAGGGISAKDVLKMSHEDFSKLTDEELARMRGDSF